MHGVKTPLEVQKCCMQALILLLCTFLMYVLLYTVSAVNLLSGIKGRSGALALMVLQC